jgi:hypothetical protein
MRWEIDWIFVHTSQATIATKAYSRLVTLPDEQRRAFSFFGYGVYQMG